MQALHIQDTQCDAQQLLLFLLHYYADVSARKCCDDVSASKCCSNPLHWVEMACPTPRPACHASGTPTQL
jgi:hypothetical protein